jgi:hypothetical protein
VDAKPVAGVCCLAVSGRGAIIQSPRLFHEWLRFSRSLCTSLRTDGEKQATIGSMFLALIAIRVLEVMFFLGLVGSTVVVIISFVEDGKELFGDD